MVKRLLAVLVFILITVWAVPSDCFMLMGRRNGFMGNDSYTKLLLHFNGTDGATSTSDASRSGHSVTFESNAQLDTAYKQLGSSSLLLDGTDDRIKIADSDDFAFGTENFTVDFWLLMHTVEDASFYGQFTSSTNTVDLYYSTSKLIMSFKVGGVTKASYWTTDSVSISQDTWYHIAFVRNGTTGLIFVNGVSKTLTESVAFGTNDVGNIAADLYIGAYGSTPTLPLDGQIDEFRISKGIARWTANFTPPAYEYR